MCRLRGCSISTLTRLQNRAMVYLKSLTNSSSQISPFLSPVTADPSMASFQQAPCISDACSISSNITTLPSHITSRETWTPNTRMQTIQAARFSRLGQTAAGWYIDHSLDKAVDGDPQTSFRSVGCKLCSTCLREFKLILSCVQLRRKEIRLLFPFIKLGMEWKHH